MSNQEFWGQLDAVCHSSKDLDQKSVECARLIAQAYRENLDIMIAFSTDAMGRQHQCYKTIEGVRMMYCFSSKEQAQKDHSMILVGFLPQPVEHGWVPIRDILNNVFNKAVIGGLYFNPASKKYRVAVMKDQLEVLLPGEKPKPEGFVDERKS